MVIILHVKPLCVTDLECKFYSQYCCEVRCFDSNRASAFSCFLSEAFKARETEVTKTHFVEYEFSVRPRLHLSIPWKNRYQDMY